MLWYASMLGVVWWHQFSNTVDVAQGCASPEASKLLIWHVGCAKKIEKIKK
jgi:hypothetical protein